MNRTEVLQHLKALHQEIETDCGHDPSRVNDDTSPLDDLDGFDSPLIPTLVRMLAKKLGVPIPKGTRIKNPYISADRTRKLKLHEVAERFSELYGNKERQGHGSTSRVKAADHRGQDSGGASDVGPVPRAGRKDAQSPTPLRH